MRFKMCIRDSNNSRQAVYGYDQRVEAFGSKGMASDANDLLNTTTVMTKDCLLYTSTGGC